eukprot:505959_1
MTLVREKPIEILYSIAPQIANSIRQQIAVEQNEDNESKLSEPSSSKEHSNNTSTKEKSLTYTSREGSINQTKQTKHQPIIQTIDECPDEIQLSKDLSQNEKLVHCSFDNNICYCDVVKRLINVTDEYNKDTEHIDQSVIKDLIHTIQYHENDTTLAQNLNYLIKENTELFKIQDILQQINLLHQQKPISNYLHIKNVINNRYNIQSQHIYESSSSKENTQHTFNYTISHTHDQVSQNITANDFDDNEIKQTSRLMTSIPKHINNIKEETFINCCIDKDVFHCKAVNRLKTAMCEYDKYIKYQDERDLVNINILSVLDDFHHTLDYHDKDILYQQIYNQITCDIPCDVSNCIIFKKHYKGRSQCSILDKIHCFYAHCYDIGHRLTRKEKELVKEFNKDKYYHEYVTTGDISNKAMVQRTKILYPKQQIYRNLNVNNRNIRYTELLSQNIENDNEQYDNIYKFGWEFRYGGEEKEEKYNPNAIVNIIAKFVCLKEELTKNDICAVEISQFESEYANAIMNYNSRKRRQDYPNLAINHILTLLFYCNYDGLQNQFSKTYRFKNGSKHCNFYHWGKTLKAAVHQHGTKIENNHSKTFYHGDDKKLLPAQIIGQKGIGVHIFCPLSTSSVLEVAINFTCQNNGLITEFEGSSWIQSQTKYFAVSWLSNYPSERECLFIQNESTLQIVNIKDPQTGCNYGLIIDALEIIDQIVSDQFIETNHIRFAAGEKLITKIIHDRLSNEIDNEKYCKFNSLQSYARKLINRYFEKKKKYKIKL